jgi:hypothetical protein
MRFDDASSEEPSLLARRIAHLAYAGGGAALLLLSADRAGTQGRDWARRVANLSFAALRDVDVHLLDYLMVSPEGVSSLAFSARAGGRQGPGAQLALQGSEAA